MEVPIPYEPVEGKTYSLFGREDSTSGYYKLIRELSLEVIRQCKDPVSAISLIRQHSQNRRRLRMLASHKMDGSPISTLLLLLNEHLAIYTGNVERHLKELPIYKFRDRRLRTSREQYHLYMLEIELSNQVNIENFLRADRKIALLPYCLKDLAADCKSAPDGFDYQCKFCSKYCYQNYLARLLRKYDIEPYIWMGADLKKYGRQLAGDKLSLGILGIACIPELASGIRKCRKYNIPAVGIPLDANRCIRWMGEFHKNSVNLEQVEKLLRMNYTF